MRGQSMKRRAQFNLTLDPAELEALRELARRQDRNVCSMLRQLVRRECRSEGIPVVTEARNP